jgi:hypothetical protein
MKRNNISGIYYFDKFPDEEKREPTCFEDCQEETQDKILELMDIKPMRNLTKMLAKTLKNICTQFNIEKE